MCFNNRILDFFGRGTWTYILKFNCIFAFLICSGGPFFYACGEAANAMGCIGDVEKETYLLLMHGGVQYHLMIEKE